MRSAFAQSCLGRQNWSTQDGIPLSMWQVHTGGAHGTGSPQMHATFPVTSSLFGGSPLHQTLTCSCSRAAMRLALARSCSSWGNLLT